MNLTPEQVNAFLADAILKSQIGDALNAAVEKVVSDLQKSYNNPFELAIKGKIDVIISELLNTEYREIFKARVAETLKKVLTDELINKIVDAGIEKLRRNY